MLLKIYLLNNKHVVPIPEPATLLLALLSIRLSPPILLRPTLQVQAMFPKFDCLSGTMVRIKNIYKTYHAMYH